MRIFALLLLCLAFQTAFSQFENRYEVADYSAEELNSVIDSIWKEVIQWDQDTSSARFAWRENYATQLEEYFFRAGQGQTGNKALLFSFFIRLRNNDSDRIIKIFEKLDLEPKLWQLIYPVYSKSVRRKYDADGAAERLEQLSRKEICGYCKIKIWFEIGNLYFIHDNKEKAREFFLKVIEKGNETENTWKETGRAASYLHAMNSLQIGQKAPEFSEKDIFGNLVSLNEKKGKVILLDFWASSCGPCRQDLPMLKKIHEWYGSREDFEVIGVSLDTGIDKLKSYLKKNEIAWTQICDLKRRESELVNRYNGFALPTYYLIDREGKIQYNYYSRQEGLSLEEKVRELLGK